MKQLNILLIVIAAVLSSCSGKITEIRDNREEFSYNVTKWAGIFDPSTLSYGERCRELNWFEYVSPDLSGITVLGEAGDLETHYWESVFLAGAFEELTGIKVILKIRSSEILFSHMVDQLENNNYLNDIYIISADLIGTDIPMDSLADLSSYMETEGWQYTDPELDLNDFTVLASCTDNENNILQIPDSQIPYLYWFRYDLFSRSDIKKAFRDTYGYDLGIPVNWAAYEDIASFFNNINVDGEKIYGHLDFGRRSPALERIFYNTWLTMAGDGNPPEIDSPAGEYGLQKYDMWLNEYAPYEAANWEMKDAGPEAAGGNIAQCLFFNTSWLADPAYHLPASPVTDSSGLPGWRVAPLPYGKYWRTGMKSGYADIGGWAIPGGVTGRKRAAAWLWAQFCVSKTVSLRKFIAGGTPVRKSTFFSPYVSRRLDTYGGLMDYLRSFSRDNTDSPLFTENDGKPETISYERILALWRKNK